MRPIRKILVAVKQPSAPCLPAVEKSIQLARAFDASIELYHSITERVLADPYADYLNYLADFERQTEERYSLEVEALTELVRKQGVKAQGIADWDYPAHEGIVRRARRVGADLIVAQCHPAERKTVPWLLHLTDWELLKKSPLPVLLVKNSNPWKEPLILAALDPGHANDKQATLDAEILEAALSFSETLEGSLEAIHSYVPLPAAVLMGLGASGTMPSEFAAESERHAREMLQEALDRHGQSALRRHIVEGKPTEAIPDIAQETDCSIVVMGALSRSGLKRVFIGNTAERVLDALPCDVLVVKPPSFRSSVSERNRGIRYVGLPDRLRPH